MGDDDVKPIMIPMPVLPDSTSSSSSSSSTQTTTKRRATKKRAVKKRAVKKAAKKHAIPTSLRDQIRELLASGRKISAIKLYREHTGTGLREAKDAVEAMA